MIKRRYYFIIIIISLIVFCGCSEDGATTGKLFSSISSTQSGIIFSNDLNEDMSSLANVLDFDFFYNGAGVGVGDFNNDGLHDLFFAGNQVANQLYVNEGDLKFSDISTKAGIEAMGKWCNGVSVIDVNADGYDDIYVSVGGPSRDAEVRKNLLFINNKDLTFTESAEEFGLADSGFSTQTLFMDFDNDGDVDAFVGNESYLYGYDPLTFFQKVGVSESVLHENSAHYYRNDNGRFVDVTKDAGLLKPSFALGLVSHDFNNDGAMDIYIANDYFIPDALYINQKDGSFVDETKKYFNQIAFFGMGVDVGDLNNDGYEDVFVADMASADHVRSKTLMESMDVNAFKFLTESLQFPYQYMFNSVQMNNGRGQFNSVASKLNLAKTDWSWSVDINDFDLDGSNDIYVTNGYRKYAKHNDFRNKVNEVKTKYNNDVPLNVKQELYNEMPSEALANFIFSENSNSFENKSSEWGLDVPTYSNGSVSVDLDNDGDLDIVVNNIDAPASLFENHAADNGKSSLKVKTDDASKNYPFKVELNSKDGSTTIQSANRVKGYFSSFPNEVVISKADDINEIVVRWYDGSSQTFSPKEIGAELVVSKKEASRKSNSDRSIQALKRQRIFNGDIPLHRENRFNDFQEEVLLPYKQSTFGPILSSSENGSEEWIYIGGSAGHSGSLYRKSNISFDRVAIPVFEKDKASEDMGSVFFDYDNDGDQDLFVVSGGNEFKSGALQLRDRLYRNDGNGTFKRVRMQSIDELRHSGKAVVAKDLDNDGFTDIIVGNRMVPRNYPLPEPSYILWNRNGLFVKENFTAIIDEYEDNIVNDISVADVNGDGKPDILLVGEWSAPKLLLNEGESWRRSDDLAVENGLWFSSVIADINNDGIEDIVLGNIGENSKYSASTTKPLRIYAGDIDDNGSWDMYLSKKWNGKFVPFRGKECSTEQMPFVSEKFPTYEGFAHADIEDIVGNKGNADLYQSEVSTMTSIVMLGDDKGRYSSVKLPFDAQLLPILDIKVVDSSDGGTPKVIVVGNIYDTEVETPRLDFHGGLVLQYNEKASIFEKANDIPYQGDAKSVIISKNKSSGHVISVGINNGPIYSFELK